jgi:hypothetical protein
MERIMIVCQLLNEARFGGSRFDNLYGIKKLIRMGAVKDAYPLHDGDCHYDKKSNEPLNDRQVRAWPKILARMQRLDYRCC